MTSDYLQLEGIRKSFGAFQALRDVDLAIGQDVPFTFSPLSFNRQLFRVVENPIPMGEGVYNMVLAYEAAAIYNWDASDAAAVTAAAPREAALASRAVQFW